MEWYEQGLSTRDIARRLGGTTRSIQRWLKEVFPMENLAGSEQVALILMQMRPSHSGKTVL